MYQVEAINRALTQKEEENIGLRIEVKTDLDQEPQINPAPEADKFAFVESILSKMQTSLNELKGLKEQKDAQSEKTQKLIKELAEAQAAEVKLNDDIELMELEWQELTETLSKIGTLNVSSC